MNVFNTLFAVRPEVEPMPLAERSRIRESLFGVGHDDTTRSVRARSESGAVVSTAPHGTRSTAPRRKRSVFARARGAIGLVAALAVGAVAWSLVSDDEAGTGDGESSSLAATADSAPQSTTAPPTNPAKLRTPVTADAPLLVPETQLAVDEVAATPPSPGYSTMLLSVPDGTTLWMAEIDGDTASVEGLEFEVVGSVGVGVPTERPDGAVPTYQFFVSCGLVILHDAPGTEVDRPEVVTLFESMSIDAGAAIDATLPTGYSVLDLGPAEDQYTTVFQVPAGEATTAVRLDQIPNGSLGQLTFGGRQLEPTTFLDGPAYLDSAPGDPELISVYWQDASTVFNVSSTGSDLAGLESFVRTLVATTPQEWSERFGTPVPTPQELESTCTPQPSFGPSLNP